ncbi:unnamed protein product [Symbiodinium natans]|uniref:K Homology domain-containing protein n=1 Tax=Symbiodinium natans TaxID=878477 RepID=A0A812JIB5_9DINO|nr:unnamed protein product [Symbiodinium natans]
MDVGKDEVTKDRTNKHEDKSLKRGKKERKSEKTLHGKKKEHKQKKKDKKDRLQKRSAHGVASLAGAEPKRRLTGLHEADGEDDLLTELLQPKREAAETADKAEGSEAGEVDDEMQEADFWNGVGEEDFEVEEVEEIEATAGPVQEEASATTADVETDTRRVTLVVTVDDAKMLKEKLTLLANVSGARLELSANTLQIKGPQDARIRANHFVHAVLDKGLPQGSAPCEDITTVFVLPEWAETWDGLQAMEEECLDANSVLGMHGVVAACSRKQSLSVLIKLEKLAGRSALAVGQMAGLPYWQKSSKGWLERFQPVIVKKMSPGATKAKVMWCWDGKLIETDGSKLQAAVRVSIYGRPQNRAIAVGKILASADTEAVGLMAAQVDARRNSGDVLFQSEGGPGADGLQEFDLKCNEMLMQRFRQKLCIESSLFASWHLQLQMFLQSMDAKSAGSVPSKLTSDCTAVKIPQQAVGQIMGKQRQNLQKLMRDTETVIVKVKDFKSVESDKRDAEEIANFMRNMYEAEDGTEFAVFGPLLGQKKALASMLATIERLVPGYAMPKEPQEKLEQVEYGLDRLRLPFEFQENASNIKAEILSGATDCHAACVADLLLLAGDRQQRQLAREYAYFLRGKSEGQFPRVPDLETRMDAATLWVDERASKSKWFLAELKALMLETKTCAFFDDGHDEEEKLRRLVFVGTGVKSDVEGIGKRAKDLVQKAIDWIDQRHSSKELKEKPKAKPWMKWADYADSNRWDASEWNSASTWTSESSKHWASENWSRTVPDTTSAASDIPQVPPPMTPAALPKQCVPETPAGFGRHGGSAPITPAVPGLQMAEPEMPAFGPNGSKEPQTPAANNMRPPATPALAKSVAEPATPAQAAMGRRVPGATPALAKSVAEPATPAQTAMGRRVPDPRPLGDSEDTLPPGWQRCFGNIRPYDVI